jgi:hypothetical protein
MPLTTAKAFDQFAATIKPTANQIELCKSRPASVNGYLAGVFDASSDMPLLRSTLIGSAAKDTMIRPVDDVDVLAVFGNAQAVYNRYRWNSQQFLYRVKNALDDYRVEVVGARGQAVRLFYQSPPHADIAPVLPVDSGGYYLPAGDGTWVFTNPDYDQTWLNERHTALNYQLKSMIRLAKAWNQAHSRHFKSFHLEVMVASTFSSLGPNHRDALKIWFGSPHITVNGPATGRPLDDYMPLLTNRRAQASQALQAAHERANRALDAEAQGNHAEAIRLWRIILGDDFPTYG